MSDPGDLYAELADEVQRVLVGQEDVVEGLTIALLADGHVLLEGVPGIAKTSTAALFARASGLEHSRIQMTPDVLPADVTGTQVYREPTGEFETRKGPIFANVVLADEINRATPKTQSALLEAMAERIVTIEGERHGLPEPFLLVATQNPIEMEGTFVLPEAQRDRFMLKLTMDLPARDVERSLLDRFDDEPHLDVESARQVVSADDVLAAREATDEVYVSPAVKEYALDLVGASRAHDSVEHGASPRASLAFLWAGKARAAIHGRAYVIPDDLKALARPVLSHRIMLHTDAEIGGVTTDDVVADLLESVAAPSGADLEPGAPDAGGGSGGEAGSDADGQPDPVAEPERDGGRPVRDEAPGDGSAADAGDPSGATDGGDGDDGSGDDTPGRN